MTDTRRPRPARPSAGRARPRVAREPGGGYHAATEVAPSLEEAMAAAEHALDLLAAVDLGDEWDQDVAEAAVVVQRHVNRLAAQQTRLLGRVRATAVHRLDGAVSVGSWYAARTGLDGAPAHRLARRAQRLGLYERLRDAYQAGDVSSDHVDPIVRATTARRYPALHDAEAALVTLARHGTPSDVRRAVKLIREHADPDGTDTDPLPPGPDERRELTCSPSVDGLAELRATLAPQAHELLDQLLDTLAVLDGPDVPAEQRRSAAQIRHDRSWRSWNAPPPPPPTPSTAPAPTSTS